MRYVGVAPKTYAHHQCVPNVHIIYDIFHKIFGLLLSLLVIMNLYEHENHKFMYHQMNRFFCIPEKTNGK